MEIPFYVILLVSKIMLVANFILFAIIVSLISSSFLGASNSAVIENSFGQTIAKKDVLDIVKSSNIESNTNHQYYQNFTTDFTKINDTKQWKRISGMWNYSLIGFHGEIKDDNKNLSNIAISPANSNKSVAVSSSFEVQDIANETLSYVTLVYAFKDPANYKQSGINIDDGKIFVFNANIQNGVVVEQNEMPIFLTEFLWEPNSKFNMTLLIEDRKQTLILNNTDFHLSSDYSDSNGKVGLGYGGIESINFYNFEVQSMDISSYLSIKDYIQVSDTINISLEDTSIPESNYIHLYSTDPYQLTSGHISATLPCNEDGLPYLTISYGKIPKLIPLELEVKDQLSIPGFVCFYDGNIKASQSNIITDIVINNNSTDDIDFPETSSITLNIVEMTNR